MITYTVRIIALIASVPLMMSGHWIWSLFAVWMGLKFTFHYCYRDIFGRHVEKQM